MRRSLIEFIAAATLSTSVWAAQPDPATLFPSGQASGDERLYVIHDVDHPVMFEPHYKTKEAWEQRKQLLREQILVAEGLWPEPEKTPLNPVIHGKIERDGYTIEKVFFASTPGHYVSGNLYRPTGKSGKLPVILSPHGHWKNGRLMQNPENEIKSLMKTGAEKTREGAEFPLQARCANLAKLGCIVFHYDMVGVADSGPIAHREGFTDVEAALRLQSFMGLQTWNNVRSLDFVLSLPDVDATRVGITGASGGGTQTMILSAIDDRVAVSVPAVMVSEEMQGGCICENASLLRVDTNNAEFAAMFAPKPLGMTSANDWTAHIETLGYPEIHRIYELYDTKKDKASDRVEAWHRSFPHNYNQVSRELMYNFFIKHLKLSLPEPTDKPMVEQAFVPVPVNELSVYDDKHLRPADALAAPELRKKLTEANDKQLAALRKDLKEYRKVVGAALRAMVCDTYPGDGKIVIGDAKGPRLLPSGYAAEKGTIRRLDIKAEVPAAGLFPAKWNGSVVVYVDPKGKAAIFKGDEPSAEAKKILDSGAAILAPDVFDIGEAKRKETKSTGKYAGFTYPGYHFGYNRSVIAQQASDVLTTIAMARSWEGTKKVKVVALGATGPAALLAKALSGSSIDEAYLDLDHFDFASVTEPTDARLLPGALKYGGIWGLAALCTGTTHVWNAPAQPEGYADMKLDIKTESGDAKTELIEHAIK